MVVKHVIYQQGSSFRILLRKLFIVIVAYEARVQVRIRILVLVRYGYINMLMVVKHVIYQQGSSFRILLRKLFIVIVAYEARVQVRIRILVLVRYGYVNMLMVVKHVIYQQGSSFRILLRKLFIVIVAYEARVQLLEQIHSSIFNFSLKHFILEFIFTVVLEKIDEQEGFKLFGTTDSCEPENAVEILEQREQKVLFHESTELGRASNLRKSLDWDTAFFTSAGLLDPEELFIINKRFEKVEAHLLPVTQEDLCTRRYADLESTLDSDDFSLDSNQSTEVDLFEDIRASIEKSNIMSNICKSVCKSGVGEAHKRETHSLKKLDDISRNRVKSTRTSRSQSVYMQGSKGVKEVVHPQIVQACIHRRK
ncbi:uncharacterized protein LOC114295875 [Camellia sinensis]|uniref:uncharacterized protein LOC114295875 n=1 Tax=Camellia sinensis TaxID=4442 RepID=UPI001036A0D1|nr:uncharacterized protein LOC114295875 [Camellia sinensis]